VWVSNRIDYNKRGGKMYHELKKAYYFFGAGSAVLCVLTVAGFIMFDGHGSVALLLSSILSVGITSALKAIIHTFEEEIAGLNLKILELEKKNSLHGLKR
jgi:hypothetical protein